MDEAPSVPREVLHIRLKPRSIAEIDAMAELEHRARADMARAMLMEGLKVYQARHGTARSQQEDKQ
jgi:hypothetical protein